jgi:small-conductance mechanosensitive channel
MHPTPQRTLARAFLVLCLALPSIPAIAQQNGQQINEAPLLRLYESSLHYPRDAYLEKRIREERARIRSLVEREIQDFIASTLGEGATGEAADLPKALDRQRTIVTGLEERLRERNVDLDLLLEEEKKYQEEPAAGTGAFAEYRLTQSFPELLGKKAILEERITALEAALPLQQERLQKLTRQSRIQQFAVFIRIGTYLGILLGIIFLEKLIRRRLLGNIQNVSQRYLSTKLFTLTVYTVTVVWLLTRFLSEHPGIIASVAIVGAGLAFALQDVVKDFMGWLLILQKRHLSLGNRIAIGPYTGDVIDIGVLRTTLLEVGTATPFDALERTGKTLYIPNAMVLTQQVLNYNTTSDFTKAEMLLTVTYESDWRKAETILQQILQEETSTFAEKEFLQARKRTWYFYVSAEPKVPQVYTDIASDGVLFTLRFTVPIGKRRDVLSKISHKILDRFAAEKDIHIAYRTTRVIAEEPGMKELKIGN